MKFWIGIVLCVLGTGCIVFAIVWQQILCSQMFGVVLAKVLIPHWSAWFYLGAIPLCIGFYCSLTAIM